MRGIRLVLLMAMLGGGAAHAQNKAAAREAFEVAGRLYDLGHYQEALDGFKRAYLNFPSPAFLFNIAQCQRQLADYVSAEKSYRAFLREMPEAPQKVRDEVSRLVDEMATAAKEQRAAQPPTGVRAPERCAARLTACPCSRRRSTT